MRRFLMLAAAGLVSLFCSGWGFYVWGWSGAKPHSLLAVLACLFPALSIVAFWLYFLLPRVGLVASWLVLTGAYLARYLLGLQDCARGSCPPASSLRIAWHTLAGYRILWLLAFVALTLMMDSTRAAPSLTAHFPAEPEAPGSQDRPT